MLNNSFIACSLDDDIWDIRFNFPGLDNLERTLCKSNIIVLNLLALIEEHGYGIRDDMYYVKEKGKWQRGMQLIESMSDVRTMLRLFDKEKILNITVLKKNDTWPVDLNMEHDQAVKLEEDPSLFAVNKEGVAYMSEVEEIFPLQQSHVIPVDMYESNPVAVDYSDVLFLGTQQSSNRPKGKAVASVDVNSDDEEEIGFTDDFVFDFPAFRPEEHNIAVQEELDLIEKLKSQKRQREVDEEDTKLQAILKRLREIKRQREDPLEKF